MRRRGRAERDERGSGSLLLLGLMGIVMVVAFVAAAVGGYLIAAHRARVAADLAAVSAATAFAAGADGCAEAGRIARANAARVLDCVRVGDQVDFVVTVTVAVAAPALLPGLPPRIPAQAHAGPVPTG